MTRPALRASAMRLDPDWCPCERERLAILIEDAHYEREEAEEIMLRVREEGGTLYCDSCPRRTE